MTNDTAFNLILAIAFTAWHVALIYYFILTTDNEVL